MSRAGRVARWSRRAEWSRGIFPARVVQPAPLRADLIDPVVVGGTHAVVYDRVLRRSDILTCGECRHDVRIETDDLAAPPAPWQDDDGSLLQADSALCMSIDEMIRIKWVLVEVDDEPPSTT